MCTTRVVSVISLIRCAQRSTLIYVRIIYGERVYNQKHVHMFPNVRISLLNKNITSNPDDYG
jgi:hypothetical protein